MDFNSVLPIHPGYALGGIIRKADLELPYLEKRVEVWSEALENLQREKAAKISAKQPSGEPLDVNTCQDISNIFDRKIIELKVKISSCYSVIKDLTISRSLFSIEESLPLDESSHIVVENRGFESMRLDHIQFKSGTETLEDIQKFVARLLLNDASSTLIPTSELEAMADRVKNMGPGRVSVTLVGAFVTLPRVKLIRPLTIRSYTYLSADLIEDVDNRYVLCEAVLGGVFLGLGKDIQIPSQNAPKSDGPDTEKEKKWLSSFGTISFISRGAIPKVNFQIDDTTLWNVYKDWLDTLKTDHDSGFPLGFKVRPLRSILDENKESLPQLRGLTLPPYKQSNPSLDKFKKLAEEKLKIELDKLAAEKQKK